MKELTSETVEASQASAGFNYNKLQAVACITCSAAVSIGFIYWAIRALF